VKYFEILGISPVRVSLDSKELEKKYYEAALLAHPDKNKGSTESQARTAEINQAYRILRDHWSRAEYVLTALGVSLSHVLPTSLAELYFEAQESTDPRKLAEVERRLKDDQKMRDAELLNLFGQMDLLKTFDTFVPRLKELVTEHKYANSMLRDLSSKRIV
jgi:curved DNA-binding protein CbpA